MRLAIGSSMLLLKAARWNTLKNIRKVKVLMVERMGDWLSRLSSDGHIDSKTLKIGFSIHVRILVKWWTLGIPEEVMLWAKVYPWKIVTALTGGVHDSNLIRFWSETGIVTVMHKEHPPPPSFCRLLRSKWYAEPTGTGYRMLIKPHSQSMEELFLLGRTCAMCRTPVSANRSHGNLGMRRNSHRLPTTYLVPELNKNHI